MPRLHVLRVFVGDGGAGGNPLGVFLDGAQVAEGERQGIAADLGFSETVFVEDPEQGRLRIFTPKEELPFAGHPLVGTAWLLTSEGLDVPTLRPPAGEVPVRVEGGVTFISGRPEWAPPYEHIELASPAEVEALAGPPNGQDLAGVWAWEDERAGYVRARVFPIRSGIDEDEATGAHAVRLAARLARTIIIRQGKGSLIFADPQPDGTVEIGGRTELVEVREH
ncbi:MAG: PhzF family phenazine biosynthesis protein [Actinomycetota bacterium]|nr:PhzF family phenazine biosynthesis protein [Actinomycetota bacterium]MDQ3892806.1 PhzF family phenazine biosynthesis protein [Actinomycetota bacterium]MDQ5813826.1 PhzF family phenazine biosynthesis protein [Actinomycetota bacterium]